MTKFLYRNPALFRRVMNLYPPYWGTGISIAELSPDYRRMVVEMRLRSYNRNAFGTHFGGSLYSMCDPHYAILLVAILGADYVIWDKSAKVDFLRPGRGTVRATFDWSDAELEEIRERTAGGEKFEPVRTTRVVDENDATVARVEKTLYIKRKAGL